METNEHRPAGMSTVNALIHAGGALGREVADELGKTIPDQFTIDHNKEVARTLGAFAAVGYNIAIGNCRPKGDLSALAAYIKARETTHAEITPYPGLAEPDYGDEYIVWLANGYSIRTDSYDDNEAGSSYVRVVNDVGHEVAYWVYDEWEEDPQLVMGAILGSCAKVEK